jgi:hypothetical protein
VGKSQGKRPLGRPKHTWMDVGETGWGGVNWIDLAQNRDQGKDIMSPILNFRVP